MNDPLERDTVNGEDVSMMRLTRRASFETTVLVVGLATLAVAALTNALASLTWLDRAVFVPTTKFNVVGLILGLIVPLTITLALLVRRIVGRSDIRWFFVLSSLPALLLCAMFLWMGVQAAVGGLLMIGLGEERQATISLWSSRKQCGKGCFIRNDFNLGGRDAYWGSDKQIAVGRYDVRLFSSLLGDVVLDLPMPAR